MWDLRSRYAFDATEGQIPEGQASVYGPANSHANCVPASFTAALELAGFPDIDPQRITNEVYGPNYRGGFGNFSRAIAWIKANVAGAPTFTDGPFNFAEADAAGEAGQLIVVAGWVDGPTVTFRPPPQSFSHASLLAAHLANDTFVIWNTWTGQLQTYSRATLAASLYEMAVMASTGDDMALPEPERTWLLRLYVREFGTAATGADPALAAYQQAGEKERAELDAILADVSKAPPAPVVDVQSLAAAVVAAMPAQGKPPAPPQVVKDWFQQLLKYFGWA